MYVFVSSLFFPSSFSPLSFFLRGVACFLTARLFCNALAGLVSYQCQIETRHNRAGRKFQLIPTRWNPLDRVILRDESGGFTSFRNGTPSTSACFSDDDGELCYRRSEERRNARVRPEAPSKRRKHRSSWCLGFSRGPLERARLRNLLAYVYARTWTCYESHKILVIVTSQIRRKRRRDEEEKHDVRRRTCLSNPRRI